jgi:acyl-CoA synthetase (NDP forming)
MDQTLWRALFEPQTVALVGASGEAGKNTARPHQFMRRHGWTGRIVPINRVRSEIFGEPAWPDLDSVPGSIDHAFVMVPGAQVEAVLEACGRKRVPVVTIYSDGFAEAGEDGAEAQAKLAARARALGVRLLGPNCIGLIDVVQRMPLTVNATLAGDLLPAGRTAVVSQSGSMLGTLLSRGQARGLRFSRMISVGNEADLGVGELAELLVADPHSDVILLFLETLRDAPRLAAAARAAHAAGKAIVAYKLGRSSLGAALAVSHTGAIAGEDAAYDAFFKAHGIVRVEMIETLLEIGPLLANRGGSACATSSGAQGVDPAGAVSPDKKPRVAVVSTTGGGAAMVVDRLGLLGIDAAVPTEEFIAHMAGQDISLRPAPVIDLTLAATPRKYAAVLRGLLEADFCDAVLAVVGSSAQFQPALAVEPIIQVAAERQWSKPLASFLAPQADASLAVLAGHGIAAFRTPEACADALAATLLWRAPGDQARDAEDAELSSIVAAKIFGQGKVLDELHSLELFDALGLPTVKREVVQSPPWRHRIEGPVAVKLISADLPHKTEAGAVRLGLTDPADVEQAVSEMHASAQRFRPDARIDGVLVQAMVGGGMAEALLGYRDDEALGPMITLGVGGRLAEVYKDAATRVAPVDLEGARDMIRSVRGLAAIRGWRGAPPGDLNGLARAIVAMSRLALLAGRPVAEAEINPIIVGAHQVTAVDGLVVLKARRS